MAYGLHTMTHGLWPMAYGRRCHHAYAVYYLLPKTEFAGGAQSLHVIEDGPIFAALCSLRLELSNRMLFAKSCGGST